MSWAIQAAHSEFDAQSVEPGSGPLYIVRALPDARATVFSGFRDGSDRELTVIQRLQAGRYRAVSGPRRTESQPQAVSDDRLKSLVCALNRGARSQAPALLETGIKVIDLFCPLPASGSVGIFGGRSVGRTSLVYELHERLAECAQGLSLVFLVVPEDAHLVAKVVEEEAGFPPDIRGGLESLWVACRGAQSADLARSANFLDARLFLDVAKMAADLYPCVDPLLSHSELLRPEVVGERHARVASAALGLLARSEELLFEPSYRALLSGMRIEAARAERARTFERALARLGPSERRVLLRARRLELYLSQSFRCAERFTGVPGTTVARSSALDDCERILSGEFDHHEEQSFRYVGALTDAPRADRIDRFWHY